MSQTINVPVTMTAAYWMCPFAWKIEDSFGQPVASEGDNSLWAVSVLYGNFGAPTVLIVWAPDDAPVGGYKVTWRGWANYIYNYHLFTGTFAIGTP